MSSTVAALLMVGLVAFEAGYWLGDSRIRPILTLKYWMRSWRVSR